MAVSVAVTTEHLAVTHLVASVHQMAVSVAVTTEHLAVTPPVANAHQMAVSVAVTTEHLAVTHPVVHAPADPVVSVHRAAASVLPVPIKTQLTPI